MHEEINWIIHIFLNNNLLALFKQSICNLIEISSGQINGFILFIPDLRF